MPDEHPPKDPVETNLETRLKIQNERFEYAARATTDVIRDWDLETGLVYWGDSFETRYGYKRDQLTENIDFWLIGIHPDDIDNVKAQIDTAIYDPGCDHWEMNYSFRVAGGEYIYLLDKTYIIRDEQRRAIRAVGALHDNTEIRVYEIELLRLNEQLEKRARDLALSNAELEKFAYIASHDLQEPLRMVSSFLELLKMKYAGKLDKTAEQYIAFAVDGASRMKILIQDLLEYSRIGTKGFTTCPVNFTEVVSQVEQIYAIDIAELNVSIIKNNLPVLTANQEQMVQLLQNLVGNAIKYRGAGRKPVITITAEPIDGHHRFSVNDNGIGLDMKFSEKIFVIFQRLHLKEDYSGTGIGLAICSKIIQKHQGKIWVNSVPGKGSTFYFTIPVTLTTIEHERD